MRCLNRLQKLSLALLFLLHPVLGFTQPENGGVPLSPEEIITQELMVKISDWAGTWQAQLPDLYISHYTLDYVAPGFASREAWLENRRRRIVEPDYIKLRLLDFEMVSLADTGAVARFKLIYERPGYADETYKELVFTNRNGLWLISQENNLETTSLP